MTCIYPFFIYTIFNIKDGLAWDWINDKLYWTDYSLDQIVMYDINTRYKVILFSTNLVQPRRIVVDPTTRYIDLLVIMLLCC